MNNLEGRRSFRGGTKVGQLELPSVLQHIRRSMNNEEAQRSFRVSAKVAQQSFLQYYNTLEEALIMRRTSGIIAHWPKHK